MRHLISAGAAALLLAAVAPPSLAAPDPAAAIAAPRAYASDHAGVFMGKKVAYRTTLQETILKGANGQPAASPILAAEAPGDPLLVLVRAGWSNPDGRPRASLQRVEYRLVEDRLERRVYPHLDGARPGPPQILYQGVSAPSLAFISAGAETPRFVPSPDRPLPDAVRLDLTLEGYGPVRQLFVVGGGR